MGSPFQIMGVTTIFVNNAGAFAIKVVAGLVYSRIRSPLGDILPRMGPLPSA